MTRGLDPALSDADLAREAARRQRAKRVGLPLNAPLAMIEWYENHERKIDDAIEALRDDGFDVPNVRESQVERDGDKLMQSCGFTVIRLSQRRRSKVHIGLPDRFYLNPSRRLFVFWEAKREGGKQSAKQREFQALCDACGIAYVVGTTEPLRRWLETALEAR